MSNKRTNKPHDDGNLTEDILRQSGKSKEEIERMGQLDRGEETFEETLDPKFRTVGSGVHRAIWDGKTPLHLFSAGPIVQDGEEKPDYLDKMEACVKLVKRHREAGTLFYADRNAVVERILAEGVNDNTATELAIASKVRDEVIQELAELGYWGALVEKKYGGWEAKVTHFMKFLTRMAAEGDPTVAGMASIHGCIGAVDPVQAYGTEEQKAEFLPRLAAGQLSGFALTEPNAGSDLTALRTKGVLDGEDFVVTGRKLFISNIYPGRLIGLVLLIQGKDMPNADKLSDAEKERWRPQVLIVDLPKEENEQFRLDRYGIHAVTHIHNYGIVFDGLRVPKKNLLVPPVGDGLIIAYHGLNRGRVALCANAAGTMRQLLKSMLPWADFRETYGDKIKNREQVQERVSRAASLIVGADALTEWCSWLLDQGYRGELECIVAKVFGSESLKETAIDLALKTHGGRSFLVGHLIGDNLHDFIAPCIYEGEGGMLSMAEFKGLVKEHGKKFMAPMLGFNPKKPASLRPKHIPAMVKVGLWTAWAVLINRSDRQSVSGMPKRLTGHVKFALKNFRDLMRQIHFAMLTHQMKLADRQLRMREISMDVQRTVTMLATCFHAREKGDEATIMAADNLCQDLAREIKPARLSKPVLAVLPALAAFAAVFFAAPAWLVAVVTALTAVVAGSLAFKVTGRKTDSYFRGCVRLARAISEGRFHQLDTVDSPAILKPYQK